LAPHERVGKETNAVTAKTRKFSRALQKWIISKERRNQARPRDSAPRWPLMGEEEGIAGTEGEPTSRSVWFIE
jgi:hypothetical protein